MSNDTAVRAEKAAVVDEVRERLSSTEAAVLTEYRGLDVPALAELRRALRDAGGEYRIYKNTLVRFAAQELDLDLEDEALDVLDRGGAQHLFGEAHLERVGPDALVSGTQASTLCPLELLGGEDEPPVLTGDASHP